MKAEGHFELVDRFASDTRGENLVQPLEAVVIALVASNAFFDGQARLHCVLQSANTGEGGRLAKGGRRIHKIIWFLDLSTSSPADSNPTE